MREVRLDGPGSGLESQSQLPSQLQSQLQSRLKSELESVRQKHLYRPEEMELEEGGVTSPVSRDLTNKSCRRRRL